MSREQLLINEDSAWIVGFARFLPILWDSSRFSQIWYIRLLVTRSDLFVITTKTCEGDKARFRDSDKNIFTDELKNRKSRITRLFDLEPFLYFVYNSDRPPATSFFDF